LQQKQCKGALKIVSAAQLYATISLLSPQSICETVRNKFEPSIVGNSASAAPLLRMLTPLRWPPSAEVFSAL
jgi:hypothetical protein